MHKYTKLFFILLLVVSIMLTACGGAASEPAVEEPVAEQVAVEETAAEPVAEEAAEETAAEEAEPVEEDAAEEAEEMEAEEEEVVEETAVAVDADVVNAGFQNMLDTMEKYNTIGLEDTNLALGEDPPPFLLDVRQPEEAEEKGHIESAVLIPLRDLAKNTQYLPSLDSPIITYCGSGWRATIAMTALKTMGYEDVKVMKGGSYGGWVEAGYPTVDGLPLEPMELNVAEIDPGVIAAMDEMLSNIPEGWGVITAENLNTALIENYDLIVMDVRTAGEVEEKGHIDAQNIIFLPIEEFVSGMDLWPEDKDAAIVVYCGSGHRSTMAMSMLWANGYTDVTSLKGGYGGWAEAGFPTVGGSAPADSAMDPAKEKVAAGYQNMLETMEKYNTISLEDTNVALLEDPPPFLLDVRQPEEAEEKGHIEGAVLIPLRDLAKNTQYLPSLDTPIITYCGSGWRATIAMAALKAMGYEDVKVMKGGSYGGWVEAGYPTVEGVPPEPMELNAAEIDPDILAEMDEMLSNIPEGWGVITADTLNTALIENPDLIVIDVRTKGEVAEKGYIDAENISFIPIEEFVSSMDMWPEDKDAPIVIYCGSGHRSTMAMAILNSFGYSDVRSLKGGFGGWAEAGYPVVAGSGETAEMSSGKVDLDAAFQNMLDNMEGYNVISLEDTNLALLEDPPPFLLDVRSMEEAEEKGHIESAVLIPLRELAQNIQYLPSFDTPIIAYCGSGWRATMAMVALNAMGWEDVKVMKGGSYGGWVEAGYPTIDGAPQEALELNIAEPDSDMVAAMNAWLSTIPEGWGGITADNLNTALIENPDLILMDVRRQEELTENGVIESDNLIHIPLEEFIAQKDMWPAPEDAIVSYCGSGHRSTIAMSMLWAYAYEDVHSLKGGFKAWADAGYPVAEFAAP